MQTLRSNFIATSAAVAASVADAVVDVAVAVAVDFAVVDVVVAVDFADVVVDFVVVVVVAAVDVALHHNMIELNFEYFFCFKSGSHRKKTIYSSKRELPVMLHL